VTGIDDNDDDDYDNDYSMLARSNTGYEVGKLQTFTIVVVCVCCTHIC